LTQAFNTALKPYNDKVDNLENEIADLRAYIDQLEAQRNDIHAWIDKRGLRPGESRYKSFVNFMYTS
jgi:prefoldin subunit 5